MAKKRRIFTKEFKAEIVKLVLDGGRSVPDVCRQHDVSESAVYQWVKQAQVDRGKGPAGALTAEEKQALTAKMSRVIIAAGASPRSEWRTASAPCSSWAAGRPATIRRCELRGSAA